MNVAELVVRYLRALGVQHMFGYPGDPSVEVLEACRREGLDFVLACREGTAGLMAEATGMLTGLPGVCLSTLGPGSTNLVNAVANAWLDRVPMLAFSGQIETRREPFFTHQVIDRSGCSPRSANGPRPCSRTPPAPYCARPCARPWPSAPVPCT